MAYDLKLATRIREALASRRDVVEKHMFGGIAFMVRGHMCVGIVDSSLMLRLAPEEVATCLERPHTRPMDFTGKPLKGFIYVDPPALAAPADLRAWLARGTAWAESQPVKAAKKKAAAAGKKATASRKTAAASKPRTAKPRAATSRAGTPRAATSRAGTPRTAKPSVARPRRKSATRPTRRAR